MGRLDSVWLSYMNDLLGIVKAQDSTSQFIRYGMVGVATNLSGYLVYLFITYLGVEPKSTMTLLYVVGAAIGYMGNRQWAFGHKGDVLGSFMRYVLAHFCGYLINFMMLLVFSDRMGYPHQYVQAVAIVVVAGVLFLMFRYFVFSDTEFAGKEK